MQCGLNLIHMIRAKSSVSTWIYTIAKNKRIDKIRKEKKHNTVESDDSLEIPVASKQEEQLLVN